ncbi:MAG: tRNA pseudouridine(38-40) synthase TruA [Kiritimatiellae bacterium]|nr:tRNA pseudouridine(38-40) synthase TruA [Kiritimatiellia bacterium]MDD5521256.1 tRNA pseudouridine(38-40) synthase TruA [Kiritimatiellia bacterium]
MNRYKITVSYDGTDYAGWQVQLNGFAIQESLEKAIQTLTGAKVKVHGSGRTDQGVHARMQVAHFDLENPFKTSVFKKGLNAILPRDIRILKVEMVDPQFHARRSAVSKEYRYFILNTEIMPPFLRRYRTHIRKKLDVNAMKKAAKYLVGKHDFAAFTANPNRVVDRGTIRNLTRLEVIKRGAEIVIIARGEGFLYKMVRSLAGLLIRVGEGAVPPEDAKIILHSRERTARVPTALPEGLFLWRVDY